MCATYKNVNISSEDKNDVLTHLKWVKCIIKDTVRRSRHPVCYHGDGQTKAKAVLWFQSGFGLSLKVEAGVNN